MKKLVLSLLALVVIGGVNAQQLNEKGLYIDRVRRKILGTSAGKWEGQGSGAQVSGRDPGAVP